MLSRWVTLVLVLVLVVFLFLFLVLVQVGAGVFVDQAHGRRGALLWFSQAVRRGRPCPSSRCGGGPIDAEAMAIALNRE